MIPRPDFSSRIDAEQRFGFGIGQRIGRSSIKVDDFRFELSTLANLHHFADQQSIDRPLSFWLVKRIQLANSLSASAYICFQSIFAKNG